MGPRGHVRAQTPALAYGPKLHKLSMVFCMLPLLSFMSQTVATLGVGKGREKREGVTAQGLLDGVDKPPFFCVSLSSFFYFLF